MGKCCTMEVKCIADAIFWDTNGHKVCKTVLHKKYFNDETSLNIKVIIMLIFSYRKSLNEPCLYQLIQAHFRLPLYPGIKVLQLVDSKVKVSGSSKFHNQSLLLYFRSFWILFKQSMCRNAAVAGNPVMLMSNKRSKLVWRQAAFS